MKLKVKGRKPKARRAKARNKLKVKGRKPKDLKALKVCGLKTHTPLKAQASKKNGRKSDHNNSFNNLIGN